MNHLLDTIAAIATPAGRGGVGIVRVSGKDCQLIAKQILSKPPKPRQALYTPFFDDHKNIIDEGLALYFPGPHSYTGEDVLELHGHGGPVVMNQLLKQVVSLGVRLARPGEFTERAFLNDKLDLAQAEAVADLIEASSLQAAQGAIRSLQGEFSKRTNKLIEMLVRLRMMIEAAIDFPEEEIDFLAEMEIEDKLEELLKKVQVLLTSAHQGALLQQGITLVIVGKPNAGKSSLLNCLSQRDSAIVTEIAGTTRDTLRENIHIDGMPVHIVDTAGLRESSQDVVEIEGMRRTWQAVEQADLVLLVTDINESTLTVDEKLLTKIPVKLPVLIIANKIDLIGECPQLTKINHYDCIKMSAKTGIGIELLHEYLKGFMGFTTEENTFIARERHLEAINKAKHFIENGMVQIKNHKAGELLAEDLRQAQLALAEITGEFTSDDLLGRIFSTFCIGK